MIDVVRKFFEKVTSAGLKERGDNHTHDVRVATCALLLEMARADGEFGASEKARILAVLEREYELSDELAGSLLETSLDELEKSIDLWHFTNLINQNCLMAEKISIIETVWEIAYTDGLEKHEDYLVHKLADLLHLDHGQLIEAKLRARDRVT